MSKDAGDAEVPLLPSLKTAATSARHGRAAARFGAKGSQLTAQDVAELRKQTAE
jgi:hypothetical protein